MSIDDPGKRATIQLRASQFVKRLGVFGGRKQLQIPSTGPRARSSSMDVPRKPFNTPSQPALNLHDTGSEISSTESMRRLNDSGHKRVLSMPFWNQGSDSPSSPPPPRLPQAPPGIIVTQHLSDTQPNFDHVSTNGGASRPEAPAVRAPAPTTWTSSSALPSGAVLDAANTSTGWGSPAQGDVPRLSSSITEGLPPPPQHSSHQHDTNSRVGSDVSPPRGVAETRPGRDIPPRAPDLTPLLRPWTPPASAAGFSLGTLPSGAISPMALGSPIVTPPSASTPATVSPAPFEPSLKARRSPALHLSNFPVPAFSSSPHSPLSRHEIFDKEGHLLRLSPAIVQRAPPWPIKNLPSLPPSAGAGPLNPVATRTLTSLQQNGSTNGTRRTSLAPPTGPRRPSPSRLSSMPALPMSGSVRPQMRERDIARRTDAQAEPHGAGDSPELAHDMDEDEMEEMEGEPTRGDYFGRPSTSMDERDDMGRPSMDSIAEGRMTAEPETTQRLPEVDSTPFSLDALGWDTDTASFLTARTSQRPESGYFSFEPQKPPVQSSTPRPGDFSQPGDPHLTPRAGKAKRHRPPPLTPRAPGQHNSHSMVDLRMPPPPQSAPPPNREWEAPSAPAEERVRKRQSVARRQSLPSLTAMPPAYAPREEEDGGCDGERLPEYSNSIRLIAQMPRKVEFTQPGVLSRDRKWRRVWCVLEGTKFSLYRVKGVKSVWEGVVGAGDGTVYRNLGKGKGKAEEKEDALVRKVEEESRIVQEESSRRSFSRQPSPSPTASTFLVPPGGSDRPRAGSSASNFSSRSSGGTDSTRSGSSLPLRTRLGVASSSSLSLAARSEGDSPDPSLLLREYTLQNAESGLGSDYTKRQNVIRVRMEGEQFLLQAKDVEDVVEWIEGFQAASDIALDLDERKMPRGPLFPRRRRRRRPRPSEEEDAPTPSNAS